MIVSDFQRGGWRGEEGAKLPEGATLRTVAIQTPGTRPNLSVTGVTFARSSFSDQQRMVVTAGVTNRTEQPASGGSLTLEVGGLTIATKPVSVEAGSSASVVFDAFTVSGRNTRASVRLSEDALAADNTFNFVVSPIEPVHITVVDRGNAASGLYLTRVLSIGESPKFEAVARQVAALSDDDLRRSAVVILNDVEVDTPLARRLARYVEQGGGLFVATGPRARWPQEVDILPATVGQPVDRTRGDAARVGALEYGHPGLRTVPRAAQRRLLNDSRVRIPEPHGREGRAGPRALRCRNARGDRATGRARPSAAVGVDTRRVLERSADQAGVSAVRAPGVRYLAGYTEPEPWLTVGQVLNTSAATARVPAGQRVLLTPSGRRLPLDDEGSDVLELTEQGFYEVRGDANQAEAIVAANVDPAEADLTPMDPKEIAAAAVGGSDRGRGWADRGSTDAGSARKKSAVVVVSAGRRNPAAGGRYAPVQPYGESVNYELPATSQPGGPLMLEYLRRASMPTDLLGIIAEVRRRWRLKLAIRGIVRILAILLAFFLVAAALMQWDRFSPLSIVSARVLLVLTLLASVFWFLVRPLRQRVTDEQVALYLEEHEPSLQATLLSAVESSRSGNEAESAALVKRVVEQALEVCANLNAAKNVEHAAASTKRCRPGRDRGRRASCHPGGASVHPTCAICNAARGECPGRLSVPH